VNRPVVAAISESWFIWDAAIRTVRSLVAQMSERSEIRQHRDLLTRVPIPMVVSLDEHAGPARDSGRVPGYICTKSRPESMTQTAHRLAHTSFVNGIALGVNDRTDLHAVDVHRDVCVSADSAG